MDCRLRGEVGLAIESLGRNPGLGHEWRYMPGFSIMRVSRAHYLIIYKVAEAAGTVTVIAVLRAKEDPGNR